MKREHQIINHGLEHSQYFQGCGIAYTEYDSFFTGIGQTEYDALEDALEQAACSGMNVEGIENTQAKEDKCDGCQDDTGDDCTSCGMWFYVSIRLKQTQAEKADFQRQVDNARNAGKILI